MQNGRFCQTLLSQYLRYGCHKLLNLVFRKLDYTENVSSLCTLRFSLHKAHLHDFYFFRVLEIKWVWCRIHCDFMLVIRTLTHSKYCCCCCCCCCRCWWCRSSQTFHLSKTLFTEMLLELCMNPWEANS